MQLSKRRESVAPHSGTAPLADSSAVSMQTVRSLYEALTGEERPGSMLLLLALLVLLLHVWVLMELSQQDEVLTEARPLIMEVSLLAAPQQPIATPAAPTPAPAPPPVKKVVAVKKPQPKPIPKKKTPVVQKPPELPKPEPMPRFKPLPPAVPAQSPSKVSETAAPAATPSTASTAASAKSPAAATEKFTEANFRANYGFNPKPEYPRIARNRGWEGKVLLKVQVSAEGYSDSVTVHQSSGHETLDESAIETVKKWKFIPAKRGNTPVASAVIVPIIFKLDN